MTKTEDRLANEKCVIILSRGAHQEIIGTDLTDRANEPRFYSKSKRGIEKAWKILSEKFNEEMTMGKVQDILWENKIKTHSYCAVD